MTKSAGGPCFSGGPASDEARGRGTVYGNDKLGSRVESTICQRESPVAACERLAKSVADPHREAAETVRRRRQSAGSLDRCVRRPAEAAAPS